MSAAVKMGQDPARVLLLHGSFETLKEQAGAAYASTTLAEIESMAGAPACAEKRRAPCVIFSTYIEHDAREHKVQAERGQYVALAGDIDQGNPHIADVKAALNAIFGATTRIIIYSTSSATPDNRKWRFIIQLAQPIPGETYQDVQLAVFDLLGEHDITCDRAMARPGQLAYLPNVPCDRRDRAGVPLFYDHWISGAMPFALSGSVVESKVIERHRVEEDARQAAQAAARTRAELRRTTHTGSLPSVIDAFIEGVQIEDLLTQYGYKYNGRDWQSPHQESGSYATRIMDGGAWVSLSESDAAAGLGSPAPRGGCWGDAFDLLVHYEHHGDRNAALAAAAKSIDLPDGRTLDAARRDEHRAQQRDATAPTGQQQAEQPVRLEDFHAHAPDHKYLFAPTRDLWPASSVDSRLPPATGPDGKPMKPSRWLDLHRSVEQMTWAPGQPEVIRGRLVDMGGWVARPGATVFNLYRPPTIVPGDPDKAGPWVDQVRRVYPDAADHVIKWCAQRVQTPGVKVNHALVLGGSQGIGKDTILEPVSRAVGQWNVQEISPVAAIGRFNGFVKAVILRISEARDLGEMDRFAFYDHMKVFAAAPPDVLRCDEKNLREHAVMNVCGVIITTNHKSDGIYLPPDDRRHFVAWSDADRSDFSEDYWRELWRWYGDGGFEHVAAYLHALDLSDFDPKAPPPKTEAFWHIVNAARPSEEAEIEDVLELMGTPAAFTLEEMAAVAQAERPELAGWLAEKKNRRAIPHRLEQVGYEPVRSDTAKSGLWVVGGKRQVVYARRELPQRGRMRAAQELSRQ